MKESSVEQAQNVVELAENLQQLVMASDLLSAAEVTQKEDVTCLEVVASEATRGNSDSHNVIEIESSSTSASHSTFVSTSSDIDNIPLNRVYATLHKSLSPT